MLASLVVKPALAQSIFYLYVHKNLESGRSPDLHPEVLLYWLSSTITEAVIKLIHDYPGGENVTVSVTRFSRQPT